VVLGSSHTGRKRPSVRGVSAAQSSGSCRLIAGNWGRGALAAQSLCRFCLILSRVLDAQAKLDIGDYKREFFQALVLTSEGEEGKIGRVLRLY
jgi:hypothetical protein